MNNINIQMEAATFILRSQYLYVCTRSFNTISIKHEKFCVDSIITVSETICLMKLNKLYQPSFQQHQIYNIN